LNCINARKLNFALRHSYASDSRGWYARHQNGEKCGAGFVCELTVLSCVSAGRRIFITNKLFFLPVAQALWRVVPDSSCRVILHPTGTGD
jgi:hypothetical protein